MDHRLEVKMKKALMLFVIACVILSMLHTPVFSWGLLTANIGYVLFVLIRDFVIRLDLRSSVGAWTLWLQLVVGLVLAAWAESYITQIYLMIIIGEYAFYHKAGRALGFVTVSYIGIMAAVLTYRSETMAEELYLLIPRVIDYFAIFGMCVLARIAFQQKKQLGEDNDRLQAASIALEEKAKLEERTRISREMHDSVGHTLTSAAMGLQTAIHAIHKGNETVALTMLERTSASIRIGLNDMRSSIHLLRDNAGRISFREELAGLMVKTSEQSGVDVLYDISEELPDLPPLKELTIYRALQEGMTNGIRHGGATRFEFKLAAADGWISFLLTNNGEAPESFSYGFGLQAMNERVNGVGGTMKACVPSVGETAAAGFTLEIALPAV